MNYLQKKKQAIIMMLAAQSIKTAEGYPVTVNDCESGSAVDYTVWGNTVTGKNLLPYPYVNTTKTVNGVTFTDNGDGTITVSGTPTASISYYLGQVDVKPGEKYCLSGMDVGKNLAFILTGHSADGTKLSQQNSRSISYTAEDNAAYVKIWIDRINPNVEIPTNIVKPQLELGETATEYEPYTESYVGDKTNNLIPYPYHESTKTVNGITFTDNGDGSITANGTATADTRFLLKYDTSLLTADTGKSYVLSGCPTGGSTSTYLLLAFDNRSGYGDLGNGAVFTPKTNKLELSIRIYSGTAVENLTFKPQLELGEAATAYEPYGYRLPLVNSGKNLLSYPYNFTTRTDNGLTFTDNSDGSITINGTATILTGFMLRSSVIDVIDKTKAYVLSGGKDSNVYLQIDFYNGTTWYHAIGTDSSTKAIIDFSKINFDYTRVSVALAVKANTVCDNITIKPQLELGEAATEYEPYRAPATANIYLDEPLKKGESVNFGTGRLPELQLFEGSNIITVNTEVKPESISVDYYAKESD